MWREILPNKPNTNTNNVIIKQQNKCNRKIKYCCNKLFSLKFKRYFLPTIGVSGIIYLDELQNYIYLPFIFTYIGFIMFWNFPFLMYVTNSKPLFYEDFFINEEKVKKMDIEYPESMQRKFKMMIDMWMIFANSCLVGVASDFWFYKSDPNMTTMELIGITSGIFKIMQDANNLIVGLCLDVMKKILDNEVSLVRKRIRKHSIEGGTYHIRKHPNIDIELKTKNDDDSDENKLNINPLSKSATLINRKILSPSQTNTLKPEYNSE